MGQKPVGKSEKKAVVAHLYRRWLNGEFASGIVHRKDVTDAIRDTGAKLSDGNAANFLKDLIRKKNVVHNWPEEMVEARVSARQRYGKKRVLQFFEHPADWPSPFPDRHAPNEDTPMYTVQSVSMDSLARSLGRSEESWVTQIAVNLHLIHTQLALFSPAELRKNIRDVRHLQMGVKTQPEIDAVFVATYRTAQSGEHKNVFVTVEAKQRDERILVDQLREQVAKAFEITARLTDPPVHAVKPMALQVVRQPHEGVEESMIFVVEFEAVDRVRFDAQYSPRVNPEAIYEMELEQVSSALYRFEPGFPALK